MRLKSGVFALLFLAACGPTPPTAGLATSTRVAPMSPPTFAALSFSCRLPFIKYIDPGHYESGFIDFPSGAFSVDPSAPPNPGYYDRLVSRWLPVGRHAVAPDGQRYAYMTGGMGVTPSPPRLHIVEAATGAERVLALALTDQQPYGVEDYAADGVYIGSGWEGTRFGSWRVDPANGNVTDLGNQDHFADDGTGHAWVSQFDSRDPNPAPNVMGGPPMPNEVGRRDLKTGTVQVWFYHPGFSVVVAGAFIGGGLLAWVEAPLGGHHEYWLVTSPTDSRLVAHIEYGGGVMADTHGIWMGAGDGLYLFTRGGSVKRVSDLRGDPANGCI